jgi:predicted transcriptional regulator
MTEIIDAAEDTVDPIKELLLRDEPLKVRHRETVRDALVKMVEHDFSQLPVVDNEGTLTGIISEQTISRQYFHLDHSVSLLDLTVDHCQEEAVTLSVEDANLFEILERLKNSYAIVITSERKPVGIITDYDTTHFFRDWSEGLIRIQNIELTLRKYIKSVFETEAALTVALMQVFNVDKKDARRPRKLYEDLSFHDHIQLITHEKCWERFEPFLKPKQLFSSNMEPVNRARNKLAHFRGQLDAIEHDQIKRAEKWLSSRPKVKQKPSKIIQLSENTPIIQGNVKGKYGPLEEWLLEQNEMTKPGADARIQLTFVEIESILGDTLPNSAREQNAWWANDSTSPGRHSLAWLRAGWRVDDFDLDSEVVIFQRTNSVLYQLFFADLLRRLKELRPSLTRATKTYPQNWWNFGAGLTGFYLGWVFTKDGHLRTELYIDTGHKEENKKIFDKLYEEKDEIEANVGKPLVWDRLNQKNASRIFTSIPASITDSPEKLETAKQWALDTMMQFADAFQTRIRELEVG